MKNKSLMTSGIVSILSLILSVIFYNQTPTDFIFSLFSLYMVIISLSITVYSISIITKKNTYNKIIFWSLIFLFAVGTVISIFSVGIFYLPVLIILILAGIL
ncbi:hypothetical protein IPdc08_01126 [archaeon]|nr:hypothetical protein IPdc08_01126 [archaeon]